MKVKQLDVVLLPDLLEVIKITFGGDLVELKSKDRKATIWTVKEALKEI